MGFAIGLITGVGIGIIMVPLIFYILYRVKEAKLRASIKDMIAKGLFLKPIDKRDYDSETWSDVYSNKNSTEDLKEFPDKMMKVGKFRKDSPTYKEDEE